MVPHLEKNIADLVEDANPIREIFLAIKNELSPELLEVLLPASYIEGQASKLKKAQKNLADHAVQEALVVSKETNKQQANELMQVIDDLKQAPQKIEQELDQL